MPDRRDLARRYLELALAGRGADAVQTVLAPLVDGELDLDALYEDVLTPVAERVGDLWHSSQISVADEHFVTQLNQKVIAVATAVSRGGETARSGTIVLACPPDEPHDVGVRMIGHALAMRGYDMHVLGASTPARDLARYVDKVGADAVGLSATSPLAVPGLLTAAQAVRALDAPRRLFVGGRCAVRYPATAAAVGADAMCATVAQTLEFLGDTATAA